MNTLRLLGDLQAGALKEMESLHFEITKGSIEDSEIIKLSFPRMLVVGRTSADGKVPVG